MSMYGTEIDEIDPSPLLSRKTKKIYKAVADIQKTRIQASCSKNKKAMPKICSSYKIKSCSNRGRESI